MSENLPAPIDPDQTERRRLAALAESALRFRRSAADALDKTVCDMILAQSEIDGEKFNTPGGRPCMIVLAVGNDAVGKLTDAVYYLTHPEGES